VNMSLRLEPVAGTHVHDALESSFRVAVALSLHHVNFRFNGEEYCVYPGGTAISFPDVGLGRYTRAEGGKWSER
jgi:hypothetical protein